MRKVLLDANLLIGAFDSEPGNEMHLRAKERLRVLLTDAEASVSLSSLVLYEVLRGVRRTSIDELDRKLKPFQVFEVGERDARRAAEIYRMAAQQDKKLDKHKFDVFHYVCAELNDLQLESMDGDIEKIRAVIKGG